MENNYPIKLDKKDIAIIRELEKNSRIQFNQLGKIVGLRGETVEYRIEKFRKADLILRFFAEPNLWKIGLVPYRLYLKMTNMPKSVEEKFKNKFSTHPNIQFFAACDGQWDFILRFLLRDENEFKVEIVKIMNEYGVYIQRKNIAITMYDAYLPMTFFTGGDKIARISTEQEKKSDKLDEKDFQILYYLCEDARMPTTKIAKNIGISSDAVSYRIKKLKDDRVIKYFASWFNMYSLGYEYHKIFIWFYRVSSEKETEIIRYCEQHPNISFLTRVIGDWDVELDVWVKNTTELHELVWVIKNKFSDTIRDHINLSVLRTWIPNPFRSYVERSRSV